MERLRWPVFVKVATVILLNQEAINGNIVTNTCGHTMQHMGRRAPMANVAVSREHCA